MLVKILASLVLFAVAAFCVFGFIATFEPPASIGFRIGYAVIGLTALGGAMWMLLARPRQG